MQTVAQLPNQQQVTIPGPAPAGQPIIIQILKQRSYGSSTKYKHYHARAAGICAGLQLFLGVLSVVSNSAVLYVAPISTNIIGHGIWSPIIWWIAGAFGIASARSKTKCTIITTMVMSVISAVTILYYLPLSSNALAQEDSRQWPHHYDEDDDSGEQERAELATESMMVITCIAEGIVAILAASLCCKAVGCCSTRQADQVVDSNVQYVAVTGTAQGGALTYMPAAMPSSSVPIYQPQEPEKCGLGGPMVAPAYTPEEHAPPAYNTDM